MSFQFINGVFLDYIQFKNGKWEGTFLFTFLYHDEIYTAKCPFLYEKTWKLIGINYSILLDEDSRTKIKNEFLEVFNEEKKKINVLIIQPREESSQKPIIVTYEMNHDLSTNETIYLTFSLKGIRDKFFCRFYLVDNTWSFQINPQKEFLEFYKTYIRWEDDLLDEIIRCIHKEPKYRLRFITHSVKHKNK